MIESHFNKIEFICPSCRQIKNSKLFTSTISLNHVYTLQNNEILEGLLKCNNPDCSATFPIIHGIPIILTDLHQWYNSLPKNDAFPCIQNRHLKSYLSNLTVASSVNLEQRKLMSTYLNLHYGNIDASPLENVNNDDYWRHTTTFPKQSQPKFMLDIGCSTGRLCFDMAKYCELCIGIDTNFQMLLKANEIRNTGYVKFEKWTRGNQFTEVESKIDVSENIIFVLTDALNPPFRMETFDFIAVLNIIDNIKDPLMLLGQIDAMLTNEGFLLLSSPYEWQEAISPSENWLDQGNLYADKLLIDILQNNYFSQFNFHYTILEEYKYVPWILTHHLRRFSLYLVQIIWAQKNAV